MAAALTAALLAACGGTNGAGSSPASSAAAPGSSTQAASVDPCTLLTDAEVAGLAPGLGPGTVKDMSGSRLCVWANSHGVDAVQLMVLPARGTPLRAELEGGIAALGGYDIVAVDGLGDEAGAAFQQADASKGLEAGLAVLIARSGATVVQLSTPLVSVQRDSEEFTTAKSLVAAALSRV
jgi:hypothetical protein